MKANKILQKRLDRVAYVLTVIILTTVIFMRPADRYDLGMDLSDLPAFNAIVNSLAAIFLLAALYFIKKMNIVAHRNMIFGAMICSFIFLVTYVLYHFTTPETKYCHQGNIKIVYFIVLITHVVLAGLSLPFILLTFNRGISYMTEAHRKMARWVYPVWLYVVISGPIVYLMLRSCYQ